MSAQGESPAGEGATASLTVALLREAVAVGERLRAVAATPPSEAEPLELLGWHAAVLDATSRLAAVVAWLLARRAVESGERADDPEDGLQRLLELPPRPQPAVELPPPLAGAIAPVVALYERIRRLEALRRQSAGASG